ncbi:MAG: bifunctional sulfate adenylyltransferase/adenylylsulfate kinase [Thermodesulfobacteriota bacterium]
MTDYSESLLVHFRRTETLKLKALEIPGLDLNRKQICDLELLLNRAFYPLKGFMGKEDYESVLQDMRLADSTIWPIPICLDINEDLAGQLSTGDSLALNDEEGFLLALFNIKDIWHPDKKKEAETVYGTTDENKHPEVMKLYRDTGPVYAGGCLEGINLPIRYDFKELRLTPSDTNRHFTLNGWRKVLGFQTDAYLHCAHREMILKAARDAGASIFLQPVVGLDHPGNLDHYTHVRCYQEIVKKFPRNMISLGLLPLAKRYAGPREALWQAIIMRNYGCSHFLVSEDHGDPFASRVDKDNFYPPLAAQELVKNYEKETGISMINEEKMVYVEDRAQYVPAQEVTSDMEVKAISSTELKRRLENGLEIPEWFSYPEVVNELRYAFPPRSKQGFTIFITGLSGAGKSTLAKVLMVKFMELRSRPVTLLDGDIVRKNLSSELNFSKEHRSLNITRIGFVASEITKNGGIAICAPIAPYEEPRQKNREIISKLGGYIEIFMSTPLEICEQRDRKGLYAKARAGKIPAVTGVTDPYTPPSNPEIVIDSSDTTPAEAAQEVLLYLEEQGYIK